LKVQIFIPCFIDQLYPETAFNMVKVLEKAGCTVVVAVNQHSMQASGKMQGRFASSSLGIFQEPIILYHPVLPVPAL
jgi:hypothetical protein